MKRIFEILVITVFWAIIYLACHFIIRHYEAMTVWGNLAFGVIFSLYIFSLFYSRKWFRNFSARRYGSMALLAASVAVAAFAAYTHHILQWSYNFYELYSDASPGFIGKLRRTDPVFGYQHISNARGRHVRMPGDTIAVYTDADGFRVAAADTSHVNRHDNVDVIFFGCSFTYGELCPAESTFTDLASRGLGLRYLNAGVSGWGFSQMYLKAKELIPKYHPRYVVFQYSNWLPARSTGLYRYSIGYPVPKPYFDVPSSGGCTIQKPTFASQMFDFDRDSMAHAFTGHPLAFLMRSGVPATIMAEDMKRLKTWTREKMGNVHPIREDDKRLDLLAEQAYKELMSFSSEQGAKPYILYLSSQQKEIFGNYPEFLSSIDTSSVIDGMKYHKMHIKSDPGASVKWDFIHWRTDHGDTVKLDGHPNSYSHRLMARAVVERMRPEVDMHRNNVH
jgi:hypothetical protein